MGSSGAQSMEIRCVVNGRPIEATVATHRLLIDFLRDDFGLTGTKRSCDVQVCGACTVLVDDRPVSACTTLALEVGGRTVETIEGLGSGELLHPIQDVFARSGALQCGFCTPGMVMTAKALLSENPSPTHQEITEYMAGNICRCTGYKKIVEAVSAAASASARDPHTVREQ